MSTSLVAGALFAWAQMVCPDGELKKTELKTIRYRLLHVAATLVRRRRLILRLDETWSWGATLRRALLRLGTGLPITKRCAGARPGNGESPESVTSEKSTNL